MRKYWRAIRRTPYWLRAGRSDLELTHRRRLTRHYRAKQTLVKQLWIGAGLVILVKPVLPFALIIGLLTTFLAFAILDETNPS